MIQHLKSLFLLGTLFLLSAETFSQERFQKALSVSFDTGPLVTAGRPWEESIKDVVEYKGLDIRFSWRKKETDLYSRLYRHPLFGIGYTTAIPYYREIGRPQAVYGFFEVPFSFSGLDNKLQFGYFAQLGFGYNLNPYDSISNPDNQYVGSSINGYVHLGLKADYFITDRTSITANFGLKHYSNGAAKKPNKGLNLAPFGIGVRTSFGSSTIEANSNFELPELEKRGFWNVALYTGYKSYEIGEASYFRGGIGVNYLWEAAYKYRLGLGLDLFYAGGMDQRFPDQEFGFWDRNSLALVGSWEWKLTERLFVPIAFGVYISRTELNQEFTQYYERIGVRYRFESNLSLGFAIKAHKAKADFFEYTIGYTIPGKVKYTTKKRK